MWKVFPSTGELIAIAILITAVGWALGMCTSGLLL